MIFIGIGVAAVNHDVGSNASRLQLLLAEGDTD